MYCPRIDGYLLCFDMETCDIGSYYSLVIVTCTLKLKNWDNFRINRTNRKTFRQVSIWPILRRKREREKGQWTYSNFIYVMKILFLDPNIPTLHSIDSWIKNLFGTVQHTMRYVVCPMYSTNGDFMLYCCVVPPYLSLRKLMNWYHKLSN